jgi:hypothetical protein
LNYHDRNLHSDYVSHGRAENGLRDGTGSTTDN